MYEGATVKFFLDTADLAEIEEVASWGALAGVTTNPSLYARTGGKLEDFEGHLVKICKLVDGPVSGEVTAEDRDGMIEQGRALAALADNMVVKIPVGVEGLAATKALFEEGIDVNMTLVFTVPQALLAARAGARYISPFVGRFDDIAEDGLDQLDDIVTAIKNYDFGHPVEIDRRLHPLRQPRGAGRPHGCRHRDGSLRRDEEVHVPSVDRAGTREVQGRLGKG